MSITPHEARLTTAFVELADTLVDTFDIIDFLHTLCGHVVDLLELDAAGVVLADALGHLVDAAGSNEAARQLELAGIHWDESPCRDCYLGGLALPDSPLDSPDSRSRWPNFTETALRLGFTRAASVPLRLRAQVIGSLNLFHHGPAPLGPARLRMAQALADTATIGILQQRAVADQALLAGRLHETLQARLSVDQAKGVLAAQHGMSVEESFELLRRCAHSQRRLLTDLAHEVVEGIADHALLGRIRPPAPVPQPDPPRPPEGPVTAPGPTTSPDSD